VKLDSDKGITPSSIGLFRRWFDVLVPAVRVAVSDYKLKGRDHLVERRDQEHLTDALDSHATRICVTSSTPLMMM
jgi:hypothetical protein